MGLASFNRMRRLQAEALHSTAEPAAVKAAKPKAAKTGEPAAAIPTGAAEALALAGGQFMTFRAAAKKVLGDALPAKKPEIVAALEALAGGELVSETPDGIPTPIPEEWEAMTEDEMIGLAAELIGGDVVVSGNGESRAEKAHSILMAAVTDRASRG